MALALDFHAGEEAGGVPHLDITRDLNSDGRDEFLVPDVDGFRVATQRADGSFVDAVRLGPPEPFRDATAYGETRRHGDVGVTPQNVHWYLGRVHQMDYDRDGRADLVTLSFDGRSVLRARGRYQVHFGRTLPGGTEFPSTPDTLVGTPGAGIGMQAWGYASQRYLDFDGDGAVDMAMGAVNTGLGGMALAMIGNSVSIDLAVYRLRDGRYPERPDVRRRVRSAVAPFDRRGVRFPTVLVGDVNGDGRMDLVTGEKWEELSVFLGVPGADLLASEPVSVPAAVPADERNARLVDLDRDGKQDVVLHHPSATGPHRVVVLMAR